MIYNWPAMTTVDSFDQVDSASVRWRLFELRRSYLLESEGRRLGHCVGSYIGACLDGHSSIWSLRSFRGEAQRWEATIEVHPTDRERSSQVRAYGNRSKPSPEALEIDPSLGETEPLDVLVRAASRDCAGCTSEP